MRKVKILIIFISILFSGFKLFSQTNTEIIDRAISELETYNYQAAIKILRNGLTLEDVKRDDKLRSDIYAYISLSKYLKSDDTYVDEASNSLIIDQYNGNSWFLKAISYYNIDRSAFTRNYLEKAFHYGINIGPFLLDELRVFLAIPEYKELIESNQPDLLRFFGNSYKIKIYVENKINDWQKKGRYEKTEEYKNRVNDENRNRMIELLTQEAIDSIASSKLNLELRNADYDADNESFKVYLSNEDYIIIPVPIEEAPSFDKNLNNLNISKKRFTIDKNSNFVLLHVEIKNPVNEKTYIYDSKEEVAFSSAKLNLQFEEVEVLLPKSDLASNNKSEDIKEITVGKSDVDINIPATQKSNTNTYALIIGNEDYTKYQTYLSSESNVKYAKNDALTFAKYAEKTLGIPNENITVLTDAISSQMKRELIRLINKAKYNLGNVELIFYFSGHGFPDMETQESYIMPVDISSSSVKDGIKLSKLYSDLTEYESKKVTVILDACFSGGGRELGLLAAKGVKIKPKDEIINKGNLIVFSASSDEQESLFYDEKQHGIFTYFFLRKLQESSGEVSYGEMIEYLEMMVPLTSSDINYKEQNPEVNISQEALDIWKNWRF